MLVLNYSIPCFILYNAHPCRPQMEYCENETLRQLIDAGNLHCDEDLVWRLFREIVEGLEHIHSKVCQAYT